MDSTVESNITVCFVFKRMGIGGAELRTLELVDALPGFSYVFVTVSSLPGELDERILSSGHGLLPLGGNLRDWIKLVRLLGSGEVDVLHSHMGPASGFILYLAKVLGVPKRIAHFRSDRVGGGNGLRKRLGMPLSRKLLSFAATNIIGVAPGTLSNGWLQNWKADGRCVVIPNYINRGRLLNPSSEVPKRLLKREVGEVSRICHIGRGDPSKRRWLAIKIWEEFCGRFGAATLFMIGRDGSGEDLSIPISNAEGSSDGRTLLLYEHVENAGALLSTMDVLLLPSTREGLPGVVLEALALGTPVVASDLPGVRWIAEQLIGVRVVDVNASLEEWARALKEAQSYNRDDIVESFEASIFGGEEPLRLMKELWAG